MSSVINAVLVVALVLCVLGTLVAWGWAIPALGAVLLLTRPWVDGAPVAAGATRSYARGSR